MANSIIFVTHSNYEAQQMAHKIITIEDCIKYSKKCYLPVNFNNNLYIQNIKRGLGI